MKQIAVFCGSSLGNKPIYFEAANQLGRQLVHEGYGLVYGGGNVGLMGTVADSVLAEGGSVIGVIPDFLKAREVAHLGLTELITVSSMHERKAKMTELSDGFIAMPGGYGTLEEFFEVLTWAQLGLHQKPLALLNVNRFYDPLLAWIDRAHEDGFIGSNLRDVILTSEAPDVLLQQLKNYQPKSVNKWLTETDKT